MPFWLPFGLSYAMLRENPLEKGIIPQGVTLHKGGKTRMDFMLDVFYDVFISIFSAILVDMIKNRFNY